MKYIDSEKLIAEINKLRSESCISESDDYYEYAKSEILDIIDSLQQEQSDILILDKKDWVAQEAFRKNKKFGQPLQQEQPNDVRAEIEEYYGEDLAFDDERTKAAYHFFSAGKAFELREYEKEREKHITDLLDNFQKGMKAGYEKAISELKEGKVECSSVMKEFIDKLFANGNAFNFGFGPKDFKQEQPEVDLEKEIDMEWAKCEPIDEGMGLESANIVNEQFDSIARHFYELGLIARKEE